MPELLSRAASPSITPTPPVRIVHLGLGAFHRAHQAWYTSRAVDAHEWGIAAFTGRSAELAERLGAQDGVYTLIERGPAGDRFELVSSIVEVHAGDDVDRFAELLADPRVVVLTLTITEAGYRLRGDSTLDLDDAGTVHDMAALTEHLASDGASAPLLTTALGKIVLALDGRRRLGAPTLAIVPCDNIPGNGQVLAAALSTLTHRVSPALAEWMTTGVSVVSTSVDRITPRETPTDAATVLDGTGRVDRAPVVTEAFSDWVLSGDFPSGRPGWETAGARFVDDIEPWEARKLWLLNGAHTLLAALGPLRGHHTVAEAVADPVCRSAVETLWDEASRHLPDLELDSYRDALLARFENPRIEHRLAQIALDAETKLRHRIVPVALRERAARRSGSGCALAVAAWIAATSRDAESAGSAPVGSDVTRSAIARLDLGLAGDESFVDEVGRAARRLMLQEERG
ncbi:mannitol dehydrogenase family protein (plasmid) [Rathayibacter sp. VKM Ac-2803]|uniref:Oxidoreductase n=1 Tax=Rathayibacter caricis DSM 15933 TaxID=1328867 RepID=A0A2T4UPC5_9MICO|nr:mannitol dehydrogenase family protein [Rathayibacter sp. VKM Ac-2803]PTL71369.1 oxidoreductase [Rathayibacter caricis DSM 15933]